MEVRTALGVELKRRVVEEELEAVLRAATVAEQAEAVAAEEANKEQPSAKERFLALGERIVALADECKPVHSSDEFGSDYIGERRISFTELDTEGLAIRAEARESYTPGSLRGRILTHLDIKWLSSAYVADTPFARQEVGLTEVQPRNVTPEVFGMLRLMEQSLTAAELARQDASTAPTEL